MVKYLVIIPARGGSKGIKNKNIVDVCGKPLIEYSIKPALKLVQNGLVEKAIVSTDSIQIKKTCEGLGIEVPFLRPKEISDDKSKSIDFIKHAINYYSSRNINFDAVIVLQPTTPLRDYEDIEAAIDLYNNNEQADSLISGYQEEYINDLVMYEKEDLWGNPLNPNHNKGVRRQEHPHYYVRNGCVYITSVKYLMRTGFVIADKPLMYVMPKSKSFNIDTIEDLIIVRKILS